MNENEEDDPPNYHTVKKGNSTALYAVHKHHIELHSVRTPVKHRGKGDAHQAVKHVTDHADRENKPVKLLASPLDKKTRTHKLVGFYKKHGFNTTGQIGNVAGDPKMERKPNVKEEAVPVNNAGGGQIAGVDGNPPVPLLKKKKKLSDILRRRPPVTKIM